MAAYEELLRRLPKATQETKAALVDGVLDELTKMRSAGSLDPHILELGLDRGVWRPREAFVGPRFERATGRRLRRSAEEAQDYFDVATNEAWDAFGPVPSRPLKWDEVRKAVDQHFTRPNVNTVFDLAGLTADQRTKLRLYVELKYGPGSPRFFVLED